MSSGTIKDREIDSKQDMVEKGSISLATKWCEDCRKILGFKLFGGRDMEKAINSINKDLKLLNEIAAYGEVTEDSKGNQVVEVENKLEQAKLDFKGLAWDLKVLEEEYRQYEKEKKKARLFSKAESNAKDNMEQKKKEIEAKLLELERKQREVHEIARAEETRQKEILDDIKSKPDGKEILKTRKAFGKKLTTLRKLSDYFRKNYDTVQAEKIEKKFQEFAGLNWLKVDTATAANNELTKITDYIDGTDGVVALRGKYEQGKKDYNNSIKEARTLMRRAEPLLPPAELTSNGAGFLDRFAAGELAERDHDWKTAGEKVNTTFNTDLKKRVEEVEQKARIWEQIKSDTYQKVKGLLQNLKQREYQIVGLQGIAEAISLGDRQRDFEAAVREFEKAEKEANRIVTADAKFDSEHKAFRIECSNVTVLANKIQGEGQKFAAPMAEEVFQLREEFRQTLVADAFAKTKVPTVEEIESLHKLLSNKLVTVQTRIEQLEDPETIKALTENLKNSKDIKPLVTEIQNLATSAKSAVIEYAALGLDPTNDPGKISVWNTTIDEANKWLEERKPDLKAPDKVDFDAVSTGHGDYKQKLEKIVTDTTQAATSASGEIDTARTNLANAIKELSRMLKLARLTTVREATWHANAVSEVEQMEALLKTDNKKLMEEKKLRAEELKAQCLNVLQATAEEFVIPNEWNLQYDGLKSRLSALIKALQKKKVKKVLPRESDRYAGKKGLVTVARADLKDDGPGSMKTKYTQWNTKVTGLENEVKTRVLNVIKELVAARTECDKLVESIKNRISGELCSAIQSAPNGEVVSGPNLPMWGKVVDVQGLLTTADTLERCAQLKKQLQNIDEEVTWAIEDANNNDVGALLEANSQAEEKKRKTLEEGMKHKARYNLAREAFMESREATKKLPGFDTGEFKRYVTLYKEAKKAFDKSNWAEAAKKMDLAFRLMKMLQDNPMGSQTTGRGADQLKKLNVRWAKAIDTLNGTLETLNSKIGESAEEAKLNHGAITGKFSGKVVQPIASDLDKGAFQRELLVLAGTPPRKSSDYRKDLDNKKKYREQALAKVRHYQRLMQGHPMYKMVMFESNPWRKEGGNVNALDLMRAINDVDLNVQRAVG